MINFINLGIPVPEVKVPYTVEAIVDDGNRIRIAELDFFQNIPRSKRGDEKLGYHINEFREIADPVQEVLDEVLSKPLVEELVH